MQTRRPGNTLVATTLNNLAALYRAQGKYAEAEPLFKRTLVIYEKALGPEHAHVAPSLNGLAKVFSAQGNCVKAEPLFKRVLAIVENAQGSNRPHAAFVLNDLALLYSDQGKYSDAGALYQRARAIREKALGPDQGTAGTRVRAHGLPLLAGAPQFRPRRALASRRAISPCHHDRHRSATSATAGEILAASLS